LRRIAVASVTAAGAFHGLALYVNDDLDELIPRMPRWATASGSDGTEGKKPRVVVLGSGWGSMSLIRKLDLEEVDLTVVSPRPYFFYTPLLAGSATGTVSNDNICESVRNSVVRAGPEGGRYIKASCTGVDLKEKKVKCTVEGSEGLEVPYDKLVIAVGADPATFGIKGVQENAYFLKEVEHGVAIRSRVLSLIERASALQSLRGPGADQSDIDRLLHFVVVGGGPTGTELCAELSDLVKKDVSRSFPEVASRVRITMLEGLPRILSMFDQKLASYAQDHLEERDVAIKTNVFVTEVGETQASIKSRSGGVGTVDYGMLIWAAGIACRPLTKQLMAQIGTENGQDSRRGLKVDKHLRVLGAEDVYAIGDCAVSGLPPTAQVASQQGKYLGRAFRDEFAKGEEAVEFKYNDKGKMAYIGGGEGVVEVASKPDVDYAFWRALHGAVGEPRITGGPGFLVWRSVYFSMLLSARNRMSIGYDWLRTYIFGRDVSVSPVLDPREMQ